jgi:hypothetical protein
MRRSDTAWVIGVALALAFASACEVNRSVTGSVRCIRSEIDGGCTRYINCESDQCPPGQVEWTPDAGPTTCTDFGIGCL